MVFFPILFEEIAFVDIDIENDSHVLEREFIKLM